MVSLVTPCQSKHAFQLLNTKLKAERPTNQQPLKVVLNLWAKFGTVLKNA